MLIKCKPKFCTEVVGYHGNQEYYCVTKSMERLCCYYEKSSAWIKGTCACVCAVGLQLLYQCDEYYYVL